MRIRSAGLFLLIGAAIIGAAFFAEPIGLDNNPGWGRGRIAILFFGIFIIIGGMLYSLYWNKLSALSHKIRSFVHQNIASLLRLSRNYWYTFPVLIFVIVIYIWFVSSGSWTNWVSPTRYYADLANGFKQGKLHLLTRPSPELLNLSNPYDPLARRDVDAPIDYSLYNGKFYLYWGPVPALILAIFSPFIHGRVGDLYLTFSFVCGLFFCQFLLALTVWDRFFRDLPKWILALSILMLGLTAPWTYTLINEPNGRIYEAAISGAQFFLMGGFLIIVIAFEKTVPSSLSLTITSLLWALAIGTRLVMALPILFLLFMIAYRIWKNTRPSFVTFAGKMIWLSLPPILSFACLGWYNWVRFGSVTETGFSYALAGVNLQKYHNDLFSSVYVIQNLYNYIFKPPASITYFPFLYSENVNVPFYSLPEVYTTSPVTGLLFMVPITMLAILPIVTFLMKTTQNASSRLVKEHTNRDLLDWIIISLLGAFFWAFCLLLVFFWAAMRYTGDFMPSFALVSAFGFWQGYRLFAQRPVHQKVYLFVGAILIVAGLVISILLSISVKSYALYGM